MSSSTTALRTTNFSSGHIRFGFGEAIAGIEGGSVSVPSNWEEKAGISSRWETELDPFLNVNDRSNVLDVNAVPDREGGAGCSQEAWRAAGACQP
jgi:hypothetical protein